MDPCGPLANPPCGLCTQTQVFPLQSQPESAADPKICRKFAMEPPQVNGGAVDFLAMKKSPNQFVVVLGGLFWWTQVSLMAADLQIHCRSLVCSKNRPSKFTQFSLLKKSVQKLHFKNLRVDL